MLRGDLSDVTLPELLGFLASTAKSGELLLEGPTSAGRLLLHAGAVADATPARRRSLLLRRVIGRGLIGAQEVRDVLAALADTSDASPVPGDRQAAEHLLGLGRIDPEVLDAVLRAHLLDATFELLRWDGGSFRFQAADTDLDTRLGIVAADELLTQAAERLEQWPSLAEATGEDRRVLTLIAPNAGATPELSADAWRLIALIDGSRRLADLVELTGRGGFDVRATVQELQAAGLVPAPDASAEVAGVDRVVQAQQVLEAIEGGDDGSGGPREWPTPDPVAAVANGPDGDVAGGAAAGDAAAGDAATGDVAADDGDADARRAESPAPGSSAFWTPTSPPPRSRVDADALGAALLADLPEPGTARTSSASAASTSDPTDGGTDGTAGGTAADAAAPGDLTELRRPKLRTDPTLDTDTVDRLIDGIKALR